MISSASFGETSRKGKATTVQTSIVAYGDATVKINRNALTKKKKKTRPNQFGRMCAEL